MPGGKTDYNNLLFNAGLLAHLAERQQTWVNVSQGFEIPDLAKYYGSGSDQLVNGHYRLQNSVNVNDSKLEGIKVNAYELGWRYTGDNLRTQIAGCYSLPDQTISINKTDMTINVLPDKRRIYGVEGAVDYFFEESDWSTGATFNLIKSETKNSGKWQKLTVITPSISSAVTPCRWVKSASVLKTLHHVLGPARTDSVQPNLRFTRLVYRQRPWPYLWCELFCLVLISQILINKESF